MMMKLDGFQTAESASDAKYLLIFVGVENMPIGYCASRRKRIGLGTVWWPIKAMLKFIGSHISF